MTLQNLVSRRIHLPVMLRRYFKYNRYLLKKLCKAAYDSVLVWTQGHMNLNGGKLGMILAIHTYGEYLNLHQHLHAVVADGMFSHTGVYYPFLTMLCYLPLKKLSTQDAGTPHPPSAPLRIPITQPPHSTGSGQAAPPRLI